ncbi:MAG: universal stress protein [Desulfovibrionaceae bacterium]|nr:universal stress protein [Desulfovibrionaceae bacterium]MBF0513367.1 universal stress protein [Desulfovibrionaceae bacterium]
MDKHLLVTLGSDNTSSASLRYVRGFFSNPAAVKLTLLYVVPRRYEEAVDSIVNVEAPEGGVMARSPVNPEVHCAACQAVLDAGRRWLVEMGFPESNVETKLIANRRGTVRDIAHEAVRGMYDAVVLGRRGLSWFDEMFSDSVSHRLLWESVDFPVWICREPDFKRSGVLVCADGSEQSLRVADHVGFILRGEPRHKAVLCHIDTQTGPGAEAILRQAREALTGGGLEPQRIETLTVAAKDPVKAILAEAERGAYAAVAIGRRGGKPAGLTRIFGQVSLQLLRGLSKSALWLCK